MSVTKVTRDVLNDQLATVGGTADAVTLTVSPSITDYVDGQTFKFRATGTNTGAATVAISGLVAKDIRKNADAVLVAGDIPSGALIELTYIAATGHFLMAAGQAVSIGTAAATTAGLQTQITANAASPIAINPIINGGMDVWQRGTSFATAANGQYSADRWFFGKSGTAVVTLSKDADVPTAVQAGILFVSSLKVLVTTADNVNDATDYSFLRTTLEGYFFRGYAQRDLTLSFWVKSSKTGVHCVQFSNAIDREYIAEYTVSAANTWEKKTILLPATPSAGSWFFDYNVGLHIVWSMQTGANSQSTPNSWLSTNAHFGSANQVNVMDTINNAFLLTGVRLDIGSVAQPPAPVDFATELIRCARYYQKSFPYYTAPAQGAGILGAFHWPSPVGISTVCISPSISLAPNTRMTGGGTVTLYNPNAANAQARNVTDGADCTVTSAIVEDSSFFVQTTTTAGTAAGERLAIHWDVNKDF